MLLPRSPFRTEAQIAEQKRKAELSAQWNRIDPQPGHLVPRKPSFDDASKVDKATLAIEWRSCKRVRVKD